MNFVRFSPWCEISECGCYTVSGSGSEGAYKFIGWRRPTPDEKRAGKMAANLGCRDSAEEARELCRADEAKQSGRTYIPPPPCDPEF